MRQSNVDNLYFCRDQVILNIIDRYKERGKTVDTTQKIMQAQNYSNVTILFVQKSWDLQFSKYVI